MEPKKEPEYFIFSKEEQMDGILHYNCMLYRLYYEYIRNSGQYDSYRHYMECFYKRENITTIENMYEISYQTTSSEDSSFIIQNTPSYNNSISFENHSTPSYNNSISVSCDLDSNLSVSTDIIDISLIEQNNSKVIHEIIIQGDDNIIEQPPTPVSPIKKKAKYCLCS